MNLKEKITNNLPEIPQGVNIYLFGSSLLSDKGNDIDLIIVYNKKYITIAKAIELRRSIENKIQACIHKPLDVLLLSTQENKQTQFVKNTRTEKLV